MRHRGAALGIVGQSAADTGIMRAGGAMRRLERGDNVGAGAKAGIDEALRLQSFERLAVHRATLRLDEQRLVPAAGVVGEAVVAFEMANAMVEKFGGDSLEEMKRNYDAYQAYVKAF